MPTPRTIRACVASLCGAILFCVQIRTAYAGDRTALVSVPAGAPGLLELGIAFEHSTRDGDRVVLAASEWDRDQLERAGIPYRVVLSDLEGFYAARLSAERWLWGGANPEANSGFGFGSMGGFYTWSEVVGKLDEMRLSYPSIITAKQSLGLSHEGRDLWMVKISDNVDRLDENEPAILFTGLTHGNEPMGMEVLVYTMFYLLENYGEDEEVTYLVNEREMYFVPVVNPDGYVYNQKIKPNGGGNWRKNRRDNGGSYGVDLNRNYGYLWGYDDIGSSPNPSSGHYRGPGPFSEPETSAIRAFHQLQVLVNAFHYHAFGSFEIHPFAYQASAFPPAPDLDLFLRFGSDLKALNGYKVGNFSQTLKYLANGEAIDWSYGEQVEKSKVFAFLPEVGTSVDGMWPPPSRIFPLVELNRAPNLYWAWIAGARAELVQASAAPTVPVGGTAPVIVTVENRGLGAPATDLSVVLQTSDPLVTIAVPKKQFPLVPMQAVVNNAKDPLEFFVSPAAPPNHPIPLTVTLAQGGVVRGQTLLWMTTR